MSGTRTNETYLRLLGQIYKSNVQNLLLKKNIGRIRRAVELSDAVFDCIDDIDNLNETERLVLEEAWEVIKENSAKEFKPVLHEIATTGIEKNREPSSKRPECPYCEQHAPDAHVVEVDGTGALYVCPICTRGFIDKYPPDKDEKQDMIVHEQLDEKGHEWEESEKEIQFLEKEKKQLKDYITWILHEFGSINFDKKVISDDVKIMGFECHRRYLHEIVRKARTALEKMEGIRER